MLLTVVFYQPDNSQNVTASSDVSSDYQTKTVPQGSTPLNTSQTNSNPNSILTEQNINTLPTTGFNQRQNSSVSQSSSANTLANASAGECFSFNLFKPNELDHLSQGPNVTKFGIFPFHLLFIPHISSIIVASAALEQLTKSEHYVNQTTVNATSVAGNGATNAGPYQSYTNKSATAYQPQSSVTPQVYSNQNYANPQVSNSSNYSSTSSNTYSSYNQGAVNSYQTQQSNLTNNVNNSSSVTNVSNSSTASVGSTSSVNNTR